MAKKISSAQYETPFLPTAKNGVSHFRRCIVDRIGGDNFEVDDNDAAAPCVAIALQSPALAYQTVLRFNDGVTILFSDFSADEATNKTFHARAGIELRKRLKSTPKGRYELRARRPDDDVLAEGVTL